MSKRFDPEDELYKAVLTLKTKEEVAAFLDDLCTIKERQDMAQRFEVAILLSDKKNYSEISALTGASSATISRVNRCLQYGRDGYTTVIARLSEGGDE